MTKIALVVAAVALAGCATVKESYAPDGRKAYALNCSGLARGWDKCLAAAGDICQSAGYDVLDRSSEDAAIGTAGGGRDGREAGFAASGARTSERSMVIACRR